jgi:hypothetical protein
MNVDRSFVICTLTTCIVRIIKLRMGEMGRECSTNEREEYRISVVDGKARYNETTRKTKG